MDDDTESLDEALARLRVEQSPPHSRFQPPTCKTPFDIVKRGDIAPWVGVTPLPVPFVIADFVELGAVALLAGEGGAGKSYTSLMAAMAVAGDLNFYGKECMAGRAVCLFAEDSTGAIHNRLNRLCGAINLPMDELVGMLFPISLLDDPAESRLLWANGAPTPRLSILESELRTIHDIRLVVIDCVAQVYAGSEFDRQEVAAFLGALTGLARRCKIGIILIHHTSKSNDGTSLKMASGSTAWINQCRGAADLTKAAGENPPKFSVRKINNGREWDIELKWTDDGTLIPADAPSSGVLGSIEKRGHQKAFLACLAAATSQGRTASDSRASPRYAPKLFVRMQEANGSRVRDFERAMEMLFASGSIRIGTVGRNAQRRPIDGIVASSSTMDDNAAIEEEKNG